MHHSASDEPAEVLLQTVLISKKERIHCDKGFRLFVKMRGENLYLDRKMQEICKNVCQNI
jgi:hypothetical protein